MEGPGFAVAAILAIVAAILAIVAVILVFDLAEYFFQDAHLELPFCAPTLLFIIIKEVEDPLIHREVINISTNCCC